MAHETNTAPWLEVAIAGPGVSPVGVPISRVKALLSAIESVLAALSDEAGTERLQPGLVDIKQTSAAYRLGSTESAWHPLARSLYAAAATRGQDNGPVVRQELGRLFHAAGRFGVIRVAAGLPGIDGRAFEMAPPFEPQRSTTRFATTLHGRLVGLQSYDDGTTITLMTASGDRLSLKATGEHEAPALRLFGQTVKAGVRAEWDGEKVARRVLVDLAAHKPADLLDALSRARSRIAEDRPDLDPDTLIRELDD